MNSVASPNWLAIAGLVHLTFAFGLILNALMRSAITGDVLQRTRADAGRRIDAVMAMPFLAVGMCCLVGAQLAAADMSASIVILVLSAPMGLLLYLGFEGLWTEEAVEDSMGPAPAKPLLRLPSPTPALHATPLASAEPPVVQMQAS